MADRIAPAHRCLARSIEDASWRDIALARVAGAVASADPERAETIARSIEDAYRRRARWPTLPVILLSRKIRELPRGSDAVLLSARYALCMPRSAIGAA